jgi:hypothetical protein
VQEISCRLIILQIEDTLLLLLSKFVNFIWNFLFSIQGIGGFVFGNENATSTEDRYAFPPFQNKN